MSKQPCEAKYETQCPFCLEIIRIGESIRPWREKWYHYQCKYEAQQEEQKKRKLREAELET